MSADMRTLVNKFMHRVGRGGVTWLANEAGVSKTAVSQFRHGAYPGSTKRLEAKLRAVLDKTVIMDRVATGELRPAWLVNTPGGLRLVKRRSALDPIREQYPFVHIVTIWIGRDLKDLHFTEESDGRWDGHLARHPGLTGGTPVPPRHSRKVCHELEEDDAA